MKAIELMTLRIESIESKMTYLERRMSMMSDGNGNGIPTSGPGESRDVARPLEQQQKHHYGGRDGEEKDGESQGVDEIREMGGRVRRAVV